MPVTAAVLVVTYALGVIAGEQLRGTTLVRLLLLPLAAIALVGLASFAAQLINAPVLQARGAAKDAAEKANALEARIPSIAAGPYVTAKHEEALRWMLVEERAALEHQTHRASREPLDRDVFAAHFGDLDDRLVAWDNAIARYTLASVKLRDRFLHELSRLELELPYDLGTLATGLTTIAGKRALGQKHDSPPVTALNGSDKLWGTAWTDDHISPENALHALTKPALARIRPLLADAQTWAEAHEILSERQPLLGFPRDELLDTIKRTQLKPKITAATGCPGCE
jgi:hypothetical protein